MIRPPSAKKKMSLPRKTTIGLAVVAILAAATAVVREHRYYLWPKRFRVVEPGAIYRGGKQTPRILRKIIRKYRIKTIVNLDDKVLEKDEPDRPGADPYKAEKVIARELGVRYYGFIWQGSGNGPFAEYDKVADILASTATRPVFVHCAAGQKRSNAALAAYWIRRRGYTFEQAVERLKREYGLIPEQKPDFLGHLKRYYEYCRAKRAPKRNSETRERAKETAATSGTLR